MGVHPPAQERGRRAWAFPEPAVILRDLPESGTHLSGSSAYSTDRQPHRFGPRLASILSIGPIRSKVERGAMWSSTATILFYPADSLRNSAG